MLFVGYDSSLLTEPETSGHEDNLEHETRVLFEAFADDLQHDSPFAELAIDVFIYPAPSLGRLIRMVEDNVKDAV